MWYPKKIEFYRTDYVDGKEPAEVIEVEHAEFNRPGQPSVFTPADLGLEVGTNVDWHTPDGQTELRLWDGGSAVSPEEFTRKKDAGQIKYSERFKKYIQPRMVRRPDQILRLLNLSTPKYFESEWRTYTREFVTRYALDAEQTQAAFRILEDCEEQARRYVEARLPIFERLQDRWTEAKSATSAPAEAVKQLLREHQELMAPIERIFEEHLKPRLDTIPTPSQRKAADPPAPPTQPK